MKRDGERNLQAATAAGPAAAAATAAGAGDSQSVGSLVDFPVPDSTALTSEDMEGLIPTWILTRDDLNSAEHANILKAQVWARTKKRWTLETVLAPSSLQDLHRRMFNEVWSWAGKYRRREANIGCAPYLIPEQLLNLSRDISSQAQVINAPPSVEILASYHHRLVRIHPFANGNGRFARLATDLLAETIDLPVPIWGSAGDLTDQNAERKQYIEALRHADTTFEMTELYAFMFDM